MRLSTIIASVALGLPAASPSLAQTPTPLATTRITSGLTQPLYITHAPGAASARRMFVVERTGRVKIIDLDTNQVSPTPFLDVSTLTSTTWLEYGLLGLVFHPNFEANGFFYVNYTPPNGSIADTLVVRYHVNPASPDVADPASATPILRFNFGARREHRAGWMDFGPDGYLYISTGDGGESDPDNAAQNLALLRGKVLRIDVNGPDNSPGTADDDAFPADANRNYVIPPSNPFFGSATNAPEIWASGLRNPWRCSFDRQTGDLWIGDVGQTTREELNFQPAGAPGGRNYGWRCTEGTFCPGLPGCTCNGPGLTPPIFEYPRTVGVSVTGGYVYRGCGIPDLRGAYIYADYQVSKVFSLRYNGTTVSNQTERTAELAPGGGLTLASIASLGEDAAGELYFVDYNGGEVFKLIPRTPPAPALAITQQPITQSVCLGVPVQFTVAATSIGSAATYQWRRDGMPIDDTAAETGTHSPTLTIASPSLTPGGVSPAYSCTITNDCALLTSTPAVYRVCFADFNCSGSLTVQDIFDYLNAYFDNNPAADINGDGVSVQDIFYLLEQYFSGCGFS